MSNFGWVDEFLNRSQADPCWNVAPTMRRPVMHLEGSALAIDDMHWGYRAAWATGKLPMSINARFDKLTSKYWGPLMKRGRCIVPADGWYEWTMSEEGKRPWHIHRSDRVTLYLAALANFVPGGEQAAANGFTLITTEATGGMVDIHDRRPVVLEAADAQTWLDPDLSGEQAAELARSMALGAERFAWYEVGMAVGNVENQGAGVAKPLK